MFRIAYLDHKGPVERFAAVFVETKKDDVDKEAEKKRPKRSEVNLTAAKR